MIEFGVDCARFGVDLSVVAIRDDDKILPLKIFKKIDTMELTGNIVHLYREYLPKTIKVDEIGLGAGVVDRLREQFMPVIGVNVAQSAVDKERFQNIRAEMWWNLRVILDPNNHKNIILPNDDELLADLSVIQFKYTSRGQVAIEDKEETRKRIRRSPDRGDAVAIAFYDAVQSEVSWIPSPNVTRRFGQDSYKGLI